MTIKGKFKKGVPVGQGHIKITQHEGLVRSVGLSKYQSNPLNKWQSCI